MSAHLFLSNRSVIVIFPCESCTTTRSCAVHSSISIFLATCVVQAPCLFSFSTTTTGSHDVHLSVFVILPCETYTTTGSCKVHSSVSVFLMTHLVQALHTPTTYAPPSSSYFLDTPPSLSFSQHVCFRLLVSSAFHLRLQAPVTYTCKPLSLPLPGPI